MEATLDEVEDALPGREVADHGVHVVVDQTRDHSCAAGVDHRLAIDRRWRFRFIPDVRDRPLPDDDRISVGKWRVDVAGDDGADIAYTQVRHLPPTYL